MMEQTLNFSPLAPRRVKPDQRNAEIQYQVRLHVVVRLVADSIWQHSCYFADCLLTEKYLSLSLNLNRPCL
jgi:hypothetical protein